MNYIFTSERLGFRQWTADDTIPFILLNSDQEVMNYFPETYSPELSMKYLGQIYEHFVTHGYGLFAVDHLPDKSYIGFIGIRHVDFTAFFTPAIEIGWRLNASYWNQGLATEGAKRVLQYAFNTLHIKKLVSFTSVLNLPSKRVMEKIGMTFIGEFNHPSVPEGSPFSRHLLYEIKYEGYL